MDSLKKLSTILSAVKVLTIEKNISKIEEIENRYNIKIPQKIREFLIITGDDYEMLLRGGGGILQNLDNFSHIRNTCIELLTECQSTININEIFPFMEYIDFFDFVYLDENKDPAVYRFSSELFYNEDTLFNLNLPKGVEKISDNFSIFIDEIVEHLIEYFNELKNK